MTGLTRTSSRAPSVEYRVNLDPDASEDLKQMAKVTGVSAAAYLKILYMTHRAKMYAKDNT